MINLRHPKEAGIYKITCIENSKVYIGKAVNIRQRIYSHKSSKHKYYFQRAILKHGWENFKVEILEIFANFDKLKDNGALLEREAYYIELFDSTNIKKGYNICKYSTDLTGRKLTKEHKEKLRQSRLGKKHSEETKNKLRKPMSEETKTKIKNIKLGVKRNKPFSEETRDKMRQNNLGKKHSEETREKISKSNSGKPKTTEHKNNIKLGWLKRKQKDITE